jgi:hypothetical protein
MEQEYKGYVIRPHLNNPRTLIIIVPGRGGKIPKVLEGLFTDRATAMKAVDVYLESKGS